MKQLKLFFIAILLFAVFPLIAQSSAAPCNEDSPLITDTYSNLNVTSSQLQNNTLSNRLLYDYKRYHFRESDTLSSFF